MAEYDEGDIKVQYYVKALSSLLITMEANLTDIYAQANADVTVTWEEYMDEGISIVIGSKTEGKEDNFSKALDVFGIELDKMKEICDTKEKFQALETNSKMYLMYRFFLDVIIENASDKYIIKAAQYLNKVTDRCFSYRIEHIAEIAKIESNAGIDIFFSVL